MHRRRTSVAGPTAKHDAVGHQRGECAPLRSVTISTARPVRSAGLWAIRRITQHTCSTSIRPGPRARLAKCCVVYRYATEEQLAAAVVAAAYIRLDLHVCAQRDDRTDSQPVAGTP